MAYKKVLSLVILIILFSSTFVTLVSASDSHANFEKAQTDLKTLYSSLNRTNLQIVDSLNKSIEVDYTTEYTPDVGSFGSFNYTYDQESLNSSLDLSDEIENNLLDAHELLKTIKGKVSSYEYVKENYQPFYRMSVNLTKFTKNHRGLVKNVTDVIDYFNNASLKVSSPEESFRGIENFNDASYNLKQMERYLEGIENSYETLRDSIFDIEIVEEKVQESFQLIEEYRELLDYIIEKFQDLPLSLALYTPNILHPGETYQLEGFLVKGGEYIENTTIDLYIDGNRVKELKTDENGHYITEMQVPWNDSLGKKVYRVEAPSKDIWSDNQTVNVVKWISELTAESNKEYYYNGIINMQGLFSCRAPIDKSSIDLKTNFSEDIEVEKNGTFRLNINSNNLQWGRNNLSLEYPGNDTITSSLDNILIKRNIPTILTLKAEVKGKQDMDKPLPLEGILLNRSSKKGIEDLEIDLLIDGKSVEVSNTTKNGSYSFDIDVDSLNLDKGNHEFKVVFEGTKKYRKSESKEIRLYIGDDGYIIGEEDDEKIFGILDLKEILVLIFVVIMGILTFFVYNYLKKREISPLEEELEQDLIQEKEEPVITKAEDRDEISHVYGNLINRLQDRGIVDIKKGKTHRDLLRDISYKVGLEEELKRITEIFEKAYFTQRPVSSSEIEVFNNSLNKLEKEVLW